MSSWHILPIIFSTASKHTCLRTYTHTQVQTHQSGVYIFIMQFVSHYIRGLFSRQRLACSVYHVPLSAHVCIHTCICPYDSSLGFAPLNFTSLYVHTYTHTYIPWFLEASAFCISHWYTRTRTLTHRYIYTYACMYVRPALEWRTCFVFKPQERIHAHTHRHMHTQAHRHTETQRNTLMWKTLLILFSFSITCMYAFVYTCICVYTCILTMMARFLFDFQFPHNIAPFLHHLHANFPIQTEIMCIYIYVCVCVCMHVCACMHARVYVAVIYVT